MRSLIILSVFTVLSVLIYLRCSLKSMSVTEFVLTLTILMGILATLYLRDKPHALLSEHFVEVAEDVVEEEEETVYSNPDDKVSINDLISVPHKTKQLVMPQLSLVVKGMTQGLEEETSQNEKPVGGINDDLIFDNKDMFSDLLDGNKINYDKLEKVSQEFNDGNYAISMLRKLQPNLFALLNHYLYSQ